MTIHNINPDDIRWVIECYGHCIPCNQDITGSDWCERIAAIYSTDNPRNKSACAIALHFKTVHREYSGGIRYSLPSFW